MSNRRLLAIFRSIARQEWVYYAFLVSFVGAGFGCLFYHYQLGATHLRYLEAEKASFPWVAEGLELRSRIVDLYAAAVQPPGADREVLFRAMLEADEATQLRLQRLTRSIEELKPAIGDREDLADHAQRLETLLRSFAEQMRELGAPTGEMHPPSRDAVRMKIQIARERFAVIDGEVLQFIERLKAIRKELSDRHSAAAERHRASEGWILGVMLAFAGGLTFVSLRARKSSEVERREREELIDQLRHMETKYRSIFDNSIEGIFQTTPEGRFITANPALARMYGYKSPEHLVTGLADIGTQLYVERDQRDALLRALHKDEVVSNFEIEVVRADGRTMWVRENVRGVRDHEGNLLYLEGTVEDVSDRWWSEQRRRLQFATARVLERAASVAEARPMILQNICEILDWDMGAVWDVDAKRMALKCVEVWHAPHIDIAEFEAAVAATEHRPGEGLAGEVWESGEPKWIANLVSDTQTPTSRIAVKHGMGSAFCVPIKVNGSVKHVVEFFSPKIALPDPELLQTLGVVANQLGHLIERKTAEDALRASENRKTAIVQSALDCIISFDLDGRIVEFNPAAERAFGISQGEALGRNIVDLVIPDDIRSAHKPGIALFTATNLSMSGGQRVELTGVHNSGLEFPVEAAISRIQLDGQPMFTAFLRDISERKRAERITSELASVVANTNDAIVACKLDGTIRSWNVGAERIFGWLAEEAIGRPLDMLMPPDRQDECPRTLATVARGESLANYETVRLRKDGKKISVSLTDSPILDNEGRVMGVSSIARDITERKRLEEELLQSQKMDAVGRLAGGIAHDFNNILTAVLGYSDLIIGQIDAKHWMYRHLSEIRKAADFAASLTHQLLAFSRRQPLYLRVFGINETVRNMQKMLQRVIGEQIKIKTELNADPGRVKADPSQIEQVLLNLCVNARDAMPSGGSITISTVDITYFPDGNELVKEMPAGGYTKLVVRDTGTGIPADLIKHIFEPFFTTKEKGQGTGLGLATCYGIVKQTGGYISVESTLGEGTSFAIYLPSVNEAGEKTNARKEVGQLPGGSEVILYVEDELSVRSLTSHVLRKLGYTVVEAGDAEQAQAVVEARGNSPVDLIFSDVVLPDRGGRELAEWVCKRHDNLRVLFTSGYVDEAVLLQYGIDEGTAFLQKPFTPAELARKVREVLDCEKVPLIPDHVRRPEAGESSDIPLRN